MFNSSPHTSGGSATPVRSRAISNRRGQALIIALCFIVLCTVLAVAFLSNVTTAGVGEKAMASEASATQLATSAVQLVEGQISYATEPGATNGVAWASQPGMIRTYGNGTPGGSITAGYQPLAYYKLYSSDNMIISGANALANYQVDADVPQSWDYLPAYYADLNAPINVVSPGSGGSSMVFPIVDPRAADSDIAVQGFSFTNKTVISNTQVDLVNTSGTNGTFAQDNQSRIPMPVRWIYILKDGTLTVPPVPQTSPSTTMPVASWAGTSGTFPTLSNPIVGRIAFWTDDECGKINVNTASEGTYWDTPASNTGYTGDVFSTSGTAPIDDYELAFIQPVQHEYQRYPGILLRRAYQRSSELC